MVHHLRCKAVSLPGGLYGIADMAAVVQQILCQRELEVQHPHHFRAIVAQVKRFLHKAFRQVGRP